MELVKTFVQDDLTATIACPDCNKTKKLTAADYKDKKHTVRVRCTCGTRFLALLEFRKHRRRPVSLRGTYKTIYQHFHSEGRMLISDISEGGLKCRMTNYEKLQLGQILILDYTLTDLRQSKISKRAVIRHKLGMTVGCEFVGF